MCVLACNEVLNILKMTKTDVSVPVVVNMCEVRIELVARTAKRVVLVFGNIA